MQDTVQLQGDAEKRKKQESETESDVKSEIESNVRSEVESDVESEIERKRQTDEKTQAHISFPNRNLSFSFNHTMTPSVGSCI